MSAREDILAGKFKDSPTAKAAFRSAGGHGQVAELFAYFVGYASATWSYSAQSGGQTAKGLLDGNGAKNVACGTLREAFKIMLREDLQLNTVKNADINERFITKPDLKCFDSKVKGNLGNYGQHTFNLGCHFSSHYFVQVSGKFYDPCLVAVYSTLAGPIAHKTRPVQKTTPPMRKAGTGRALIILQLMAGKSLPGFGEGWQILLPAECKKKGVLTIANLKALKEDPDIKGSRLI